MENGTISRLELVQVADAVAREKNIDRQVVLDAMAEAIQRAARSRYGAENDITAEIDGKNGEINLYRCLTVVEVIENENTEIDLETAKLHNPDAGIGDVLADRLPPIDFGRIAAQAAKQVIVQKVRDAERDQQFDEFKDRVGEMIHGLIKRVEHGNVYVDLGRAEAYLRRDEILPRETLRRGDRVRAYLMDVRRENRGPQLFLSRTHPQFMASLFAQEVPEIYDGIIEIKAVARDPGSRAKIAVHSGDPSIDPVGACVGMRGSRVQAVVNELQGEKIDIIPWSEDPAAFVVNALAPAEVSKLVLDEDQGRIEVVVPDEMLSQAIGRRGQNVRLASQLVGWDIDIMTETEESERRQKEFTQRTDMFVSALNVDDMIGQLLATEGYSDVEDVAEADISELVQIEAFDEDIAEALRQRAQEYIEQEAAVAEERRLELGVTEDVAAFEVFTAPMLVKLGENGVKTLDDLADLAGDELIEIVGADLTEDVANEIIMQARAHWFEDEEVAEAEADATEEA